MPEVICNTSPSQYLHQIDQLNIIPALVGSIIVPPAVLVELDAGIAKDWTYHNQRTLNGSGYRRLPAPRQHL